MLELSTTAGYALLALGYLEKSRDHWVLAKEIADRTGVAGPYLSQVLHTLMKAGIVIAKRGYRGGFMLSRPGAEIALLDIVNAVERRPREQRCLLGLAECSDHSGCPVHIMWKTARTQIEGQLAGLTLDRVADAFTRRGARVAALSGSDQKGEGRRLSRRAGTEAAPPTKKSRAGSGSAKRSRPDR